MNDRKRQPKVFISYCHESQEHDKNVLALADHLCKDGLDCNIDQYVESPRLGWPRWMEQQIRDSDFVLVACTATYDKRARGDEIPGKGKGARFESLLTYQDIFDNDSKNDKFIPILFDSNDSKFIPKPLKPFQYYLVDTKSGYEKLYRKLTSQPLIVKPKIGKTKLLPSGVNLNKQFQIEDYVTSVTKPTAQTNENEMEIIISINRDFNLFSIKEREKLLAAVSELLEIKGNLKITKMQQGSVKISLKLNPKDAGKLLVAAKLGELKEYDVVDAELKKGQKSEIESEYSSQHPFDAEWIASRRESVKYYLEKKWALHDDDLEELTQATMVAALYSLTNDDKDSKKRPSTFLLDIADNVAKSFFRRHGRNLRRSLPVEIAESIGVIFKDEVEANELRQRLKGKLALLPKQYVQILELIFYQGYKEREVSAELGISPDRVYTMKSDALKRLRKLCKKDPVLNPLFE
jgi:RNA polymerase sigma factor (sigma-70 family)